MVFPDDDILDKFKTFAKSYISELTNKIDYSILDNVNFETYVS